jgi:PAS domain S-box-containing protein
MTTKAIDLLLKEKQKFEALFSFATIGIVIANSKGEITLVNQQAESIFGYKGEELTGKKVDILLPEGKRHQHQLDRQHYTIHPKVRPMGSGRDLIAVRKDQSKFPVEISLSYFNTEEGLFVIAFILDITLRKESEAILLKQKADLETVTKEVKELNANLEEEVEKRTDALRQTLTQLEASQKDLQLALDREKQLGELKSRFVTMASHEFKTPLATIMTSATLAGKYIKTEEQAQREKHLKRISDTVQNLTTLLNEFLSIGKLEEGKINPKKEIFHLPELMKEVISEMQNHANDGKQILYTPDGVSTVNMDKEMLRNVMINLLSNALKFSSPQGLIQVAVKKQDQDQSKVEIFVKDQGIGISKEDQEHLFERFFRGKNAVNIQGTGLGLHIVQRYVSLLEGEIFVESALDNGTTIKLIIPNT